MGTNEDNETTESTVGMFSSTNFKWPGWHTVREIGRGASGVVYEIQKVEDENIFRAALKVIRVPKDNSEVEKLREDGWEEKSIHTYFESIVKDIGKECALMSELQGCPNIVHYDDHKIIRHTDKIGWDILIKMELLKPFNKYVQENGLTVMPEPLVRQCGIELCKALEACQAKHIIHRDIKPSNMFITEYNTIKLGDFGIARMLDHSDILTQTGTYPYMAPEIYRGERAGFAADIYSVGMVMYRYLNDNVGPFETPTNRTTRSIEEAQNRRFGGEKLPPPRRGSEQLKGIVLCATDPDPTKRFIYPGDMRRALETPEIIPESSVMTTSPNMIRNIIIGLTIALVAALAVFIVLKVKPDEDTPSTYSASTDAEFSYPDVLSDSAPKLLIDSSVILLGDVIPIRFFDGEQTYAFADGLSYYSKPNTVDIHPDEDVYRNYIVTQSAGETTVIGKMGTLELKKDIYVLNRETATNGVLCDTDKIEFYVTDTGPGAANLKLTVDGKKGEELEARVYTNAGTDMNGNVWVTADAEWEENTLNLTVSNYLSPHYSGELVVVFTEKGNPSKLVGFKVIPIEIK